ncbi:MAG TPA: esterase-like activity of phytase family protein, partial [Candidatus Polarisedimenticolia bacterium]|nr:esterase-like activity of phytase family protein [Candidatus Polarisedimenticolia bacterium]
PRPLLTPLWRDAPADPLRVRVDALPGIEEPSDLLFVEGELYTVSDAGGGVVRIRFDGPGGAPRRAGSWLPRGVPPGSDLEAMTRLDGGEVVIAAETDGALFVLSPFPQRACAAWLSGVDGACLIGKNNCGIEALAALPGGRLFVAKERDLRAAWLFDLPGTPCGGATLSGKTYLTLPEEVGPDIAAAAWDPEGQRLLLVARSRQRVLELELPPSSGPGDTSPRRLVLAGSFGYASTERTLDYAGLDFHQVEGIAVDPRRTLHLVVDNNGRQSRRFGKRSAALLRFFAPAADPAPPPD